MNHLPCVRIYDVLNVLQFALLQTKQARNRVFKILCHTVGNKLMKHITPRGMVQPVGEGLGIFMHDRAINGCWDIPNLYS